MRYHIKKSTDPTLNGDYEVKSLGGYKHFPDRTMQKENIHALIGRANGLIRINQQIFQLLPKIAMLSCRLWVSQSGYRISGLMWIESSRRGEIGRRNRFKLCRTVVRVGSTPTAEIPLLGAI